MSASRRVTRPCRTSMTVTLRLARSRALLNPPVGSRSIAMTLRPPAAAAAHRAYLLVVFPTPPFSDAIVITSAGTTVEYPHMATAAPHVKLLRQLASAKDDYLSGAFDVSWDGPRATTTLVFGRPSHAVFEMDQAQIEGEAAIDALLAELPKVFAVSDWRRAMSPRETLSITIDELAGPFVRLAGSYADD